MSLHLTPVRFRDASAFVAMWHRHHPPPVGCKFCVGVADDDGVLRGVAVVGRPVARHYDNGQTLEVTRTATDGSANANSLLYGAAWRAAKALGYTRLITYTQAGESGASLRAAGWRVLAERPARPGWTTPSRPREERGTEHMPRTLGRPPRDRQPLPRRPATPQPPAHHPEGHPPVIREDRFLISRKPYAVDLDSLTLTPGGTRYDGQPMHRGRINAVWFRRRRGVTVACIGTLWDTQCGEPPKHAAEFLARHDDGRYGGDCAGRWDGTSYWGHKVTLAEQEQHLAVLRPMLATYPDVPAGYDGWYTFADGAN